MQLIQNKTLNKKLLKISSIGVEVDNGFIFGNNENNQLTPLSQEMFEIVAIALMSRKVKVDCFDRSFILECREV